MRLNFIVNSSHWGVVKRPTWNGNQRRLTSSCILRSQVNHVVLCMIKDKHICTEAHFMTQHIGELEDWEGTCNSFSPIQRVLQDPPSGYLMPTIKVCLLCESTIVRIFVYNANISWGHVINSKNCTQTHYINFPTKLLLLPGRAWSLQNEL